MIDARRALMDLATRLDREAGMMKGAAGDKLRRSVYAEIARMAREEARKHAPDSRPVRHPYAYVCQACSHPAAQHRDAGIGYHCITCDCVMQVDSPCVGISRVEYEIRFGLEDTPSR